MAASALVSVLMSVFSSTLTSAFASALVSAPSGLPDGAVARRRRRSPAGCSSLFGWPGISICCWAAFSAAGAPLAAFSAFSDFSGFSAFSALGALPVSAASLSPVRALEVVRRFGLVSAAGASAGLSEPGPWPCFSLMTSINWPLRIRAVPLMPRLEASCWSSARTMASRPVPERRRREALAGAAPVAGAAGASVAGAEALPTEPSAVTPIRSVVSLTKGSFPGAGVGLSGSATGCAVRLRSLACGPGRGGGPPVRRKDQFMVPA